MGSIWQDFRYAVRLLRKNVMFTAIAVLALALGIGANTTIFSLINALLINPLPLPELDRLVAIWEKIPSQGVDRNETAIANYLDWKAQNSTFENVSLYTWWNANLGSIDPPERVQGYLVTANFLDTIAVKPLLGRNFSAEEEQDGNDRVAIISYGLWQRRFAANPDIINHPVVINGVTRTLIGVMPEGYNYPTGVEVLSPYAFNPQQAANRQSHGSLTIACLKPGVTMGQAQADLDGIAARLREQYPQTNTGRGVAVYSLLNDTVRHYRASLLVISFAVAFVLLIACANVANLLLARAASRSQEIALRSALGASRWRIVRQMLMESIVLAGIGGAVGVLFALWGVESLKAAMPADFSQLVIGWQNIGINFSVLTYTLILSLLVGILFGLAPALQASKPDLNETLKEGGRSAAHATRHRLRTILVIGEVALSMVLLIGAGLAMKSFLQMMKKNPGFNPQNVLTMSMTLPRAKYTDDAKRIAFYEDLLKRVETMPGVGAAGLVNYLPLGGSNSSDSFLVEGVPEPPPGEEFIGRRRVCSPNYFQAMGITLLKGRAFAEQDRAGSEPVAIINETMARQYWADGEAIGKRFRFTGAPERNPWLNIVGVIKDVSHELYSPVTAEYYLPMAQDAWGTMILAAHTTTDPLALAPVIRSEVQRLDKDQPVYDIKTMEQVRSMSILPMSFVGVLLGVFAVVALLLASIGIYGVMNYHVTERTHEIGIRMALGAKASDVLKMVILQGMLMAGIGFAIGILGGYSISKAMATVLVEVSTTDWTTFLGIPFLVVCVAFIACYVPARRATKVDPMVALRYE